MNLSDKTGITAAAKFICIFEKIYLQRFCLLWLCRSSPSEVFLGKGVLKICNKFTGEHPCRSVISIKLQSNFFEIALRHGCSPVNLLHIFRTPFLINTLGWLLLTLLIEAFLVEMNLHNKKWLLLCSYNPKKSNIKNYLQALSTSLDLYSSQFDQFIIFCDFNVEIENSEMKEFCLNYNLKSLIRAPTCLKNPETSSYIDLILTQEVSKVAVL